MKRAMIVLVFGLILILSLIKIGSSDCGLTTGCSETLLPNECSGPMGCTPTYAKVTSCDNSCTITHCKGYACTLTKSGTGYSLVCSRTTGGCGSDPQGEWTGSTGYRTSGVNLYSTICSKANWACRASTPHYGFIDIGAKVESIGGVWILTSTGRANCVWSACPDWTQASCTPGPACVDNDHDGYGNYCCLGADCNDANPSVHNFITCNYNGVSCGTYSLCAATCPIPPVEICGNGIDDDCDGLIDPGCTEYCNGIDDDGDGLIDEGGGALCDPAHPTDWGCCGGFCAYLINNNRDCGSCGNTCLPPQICENINCVTPPPSCTDDCPVLSQIETVCSTLPASAINRRICGNYDADSCLEWSSWTFLQDCDDGLACNGIETCAAGACVAGTPISCNDDVACTTDSCTNGVLGAYTCNNINNCPLEQTCNLQTGVCEASGSILLAYWRKDGVPITQVNSGDLVEMVASCSGLNGQTIDFRVYNDSGEVLPGVPPGLPVPPAPKRATVNSGIAFYPYGTTGQTHLRFNASLNSNPLISRMSDWLTIVSSSCTPDNNICAGKQCGSFANGTCGTISCGPACNDDKACTTDSCNAGQCSFDDTCTPPETCQADGTCSSGSSISDCSDYTESGESTCIDDLSEVGIASVEKVEGIGFCGDDDGDGCVIDCECSWNINLCEAGWSTSGNCEGEEGSCDYASTTLKDCDELPQEGFRIVEIGKTWTGDPASEFAAQCSGSEELTRKCISSTVLGFFDWFGIIIVIGIIGLFYFLIYRRF